MARSLAKIRRLADVFRSLETSERAKVADLARQILDLQTQQAELLASLSTPTAETEPFLPLMSRSVGSMQGRLERLAREHDMAVQRYAQAAARTRGANALLSDARAEEERKAEQRALESLLEFQQSIIAQGRCKSERST